MTDDVLCVRYSPNGLLLAISLLDSTIKLFYSDTLKFFLSLFGHKLPVTSMDISSDGTLLVSGSSDKTIKVWGLDFGDCHCSLRGHEDAVMATQFIWGTHHLVSVGKDRDVILWDIDAREKLQTLRGHHSEVWSLAVAKYGRFILSGSHDRSIRRWTKTEDQFVLDEAREEELQTLYDKMELKQREVESDQLVGTGAEGSADQLAVTQKESEVGSAGLSTLETLKAGERIMEALTAAQVDMDDQETFQKVGI